MKLNKQKLVVPVTLTLTVTKLKIQESRKGTNDTAKFGSIFVKLSLSFKLLLISHIPPKYVMA